MSSVDRFFSPQWPTDLCWSAKIWDFRSTSFKSVLKFIFLKSGPLRYIWLQLKNANILLLLSKVYRILKGKYWKFRRICQDSRNILLTWNTVTMAQSSESKFFLSDTVSPFSRRVNLHPNRCIPNILQHRRQET